MSKIHVVAKRDFLESLTVARPMVALAELVWNGFDAMSEQVQVHLDMNRMGGLQTIRVRDYGYGINHAHVEDLFGSLGDSWKKKKARQDGRALHGKSGKGRFRAFALGTLVEWNTTFRGEDGKSRSYRIRGQAMTLDDFDIFDPIEANGAATGTEVVISNLKYEFGSLMDTAAPLELAKLFAAYLTEYPALKFEYNGVRVDPKSAQKNLKDYHLGDVDLGNDRKARVAVSVVEWNIPTERVLHLCDASGVALHETQAGQQIRAPGFNFTAYVKSDHFRELDKQNQLVLEELHPDVLAIVKVAKDKIKEHFRLRLLEDQGRTIERWKNEQIYPYEDRQDLDPLEQAERQVFDILAVNVESYLPSFEESDTKSKKFTFRLLAQAVRENPDSVQEIIGEVLGLRKDAQDELAELLRKTPLSSIISAAKIVANRLDFLLGCALAMHEALADLNLRRIELGKQPLRMRIGIHSGSAIVGSIGAPHRREFTVVGDTVNVASRLEQVAKLLQENIVISEATREGIGERFFFKPLETVEVKGKAKPVRIYAPTRALPRQEAAGLSTNQAAEQV
jgi:class 3 adenylate cyclase